MNTDPPLPLPDTFESNHELAWILTVERLRELFRYDCETGEFIRIAATCPRYAGDVGKRAGSPDGLGYRQIRIDGKLYRCHRLAWLYVFGEWPTKYIDHIDGDRGNDRIGNLRDVPQARNMENKRGAAKNNRSGLLGVVPTRGSRFCAQLCIGGRSTHLGTFDTAEEAHRAYVEAKRQHHAGCTL